MKITFEGETLDDIFNQMENALDCSVGKHKDPGPQSPTLQVNALKDIAPEAIAPVDNTIGEIPEKSPTPPTVTKTRTPKQLENDERLRAAAKAKLAAKKTKAAPEPKPQEPFFDPADVVKLRQRTLEDLQTAYANGHHQEVLELLSRFGDGAKSFRELPPDAFVPIREAIDSGALA